MSPEVSPATIAKLRPTLLPPEEMRRASGGLADKTALRRDGGQKVEHQFHVARYASLG